jgi:excisionase family DNA binding protein
MMIMETYLTTKQVQDLFKIDRITVYRMLQDGRLKGVKIGNQWRFSQSEVERLLSGEPVQTFSEESTTFPTHCVQAIQDLFSSVSQISGLLVNNDGEPVTEISSSTRFCNLMQSTESGKKACLNSWKQFTSQFGEKTKKLTCHAGLNYLPSNVSNEEGIHGLFLAGEFYWDQPDLEEADLRYHHLADEHNIKVKELIEAARKIPVLSSEQQFHLSAQPAAAAKAIVSILNERNGFLTRMQKIANLTQNL